MQYNTFNYTQYGTNSQHKHKWATIFCSQLSSPSACDQKFLNLKRNMLDDESIIVYSIKGIFL